MEKAPVLHSFHAQFLRAWSALCALKEMAIHTNLRETESLGPLIDLHFRILPFVLACGARESACHEPNKQGLHRQIHLYSTTQENSREVQQHTGSARPVHLDHFLQPALTNT